MIKRPVPKLLLFGGTTEARELLEHGLPAICCVATEYGAELVRDLPNADTRVGRLDVYAMQDLICSEKISCVIDATHPYAVEVTANIKQACAACGVPLLRAQRPAVVTDHDIDLVSNPDAQDIIRVESCAAAAEWLNENCDDKSRALLTIGTKELHVFSKVQNYQERLVARVLPTVESLKLCADAGFVPSNIIAMRGPFSRDMNIAMLRDTGASVLVTKDSGVLGGTQEKISAAREVGAKIILIARPDQARSRDSSNDVNNVNDVNDEYVSVPEALLWVRRKLGLNRPPFFPLLIDLENKIVLVVGGGKIAGRRAKTFLKCGARVRAVSLEFAKDFPVVNVERITRTIEPDDPDLNKIFDNITLVTTACSDREINKFIGREARKRGIPVSVADSAAEGDYFFPSLITCGDNTDQLSGISRAAAASVSSAGLSARLTQRLSDKLRAVWDEWVREIENGIMKEIESGTHDAKN